ncbi:sensor histidine kinase [Paucibacter sp. B51]|uniref:sensor histidine kinase n=1 Tax=Paucibacter sp. B51 TaxID=2993315 RepID=UPI0022EBDBB9|nr:ATP-binding protein [Paucibacter sp. B51]
MSAANEPAKPGLALAVDRGFAGRLRRAALLGGAPAWALACLLVWQQPWLIYPKLLCIALCSLGWLGTAAWLHARAEHQRRLLGHVIEAMANGDYSQRLRLQGGSAEPDALATQLNALVDSLHQQRLQSLAAERLAENVLQTLDVAVFAFDAQERLQLANPSALGLLRRAREHALGRSAAELGLDELLRADPEALREQVFPGAAGLWRLRQHRYEVEGQARRLLFVSDLKQVLRSEELQAWQRLLRVLSHEVNNSLAPIASLSDTLRRRLDALGPGAILPPDDWRAEQAEALGLIEERARHLADFVRRHAQLARPLEPRMQRFDLLALLRRLPALLPQAQLTLEFDGISPDAGLDFYGDPGLLEQLFINLLKNGIEAGGAPLLLRLKLRLQAEPLQISLLDRGCGLANPANLFVPYYTTKPQGSGIGLVLARQIAECHQGSLQLLPRSDGPGCQALLRFARSQG